MQYSTLFQMHLDTAYIPKAVLLQMLIISSSKVVINPDEVKRTGALPHGGGIPSPFGGHDGSPINLSEVKR